MTPICSHNLCNRSVIFNTSNTIKINFKNKLAKALVTFDGHSKFNNDNILSITINASKKKFFLLCGANYSYFSTLNNKFNWGN